MLVSGRRIVVGRVFRQIIERFMFVVQSFIVFDVIVYGGEFALSCVLSCRPRRSDGGRKSEFLAVTH
jgi:hypothetical protein